jgi:5-(carboxyamino)imidazole ribonucleotide synthase
MLIAILGGGQLARMLALAGLPLGLRFRVLDPAADPCAAAVAEHIRGEFTDPAALAQLVSGADLLTFDFENVPAQVLEQLSDSLPARPGPAILAMSQDRLLEKQAFAQLGVPVAAHAAVHDSAQVRAAMQKLGGPVIVKTRRFGYDGKGQVRIKHLDDVSAAMCSMGNVPAIAEALVPFQRELSLVAVRSSTGELRCYPLVENVHIDGILALTLAPARVGPELSEQARRAAAAVADQYDYIGCFALEFFELDGQLVLNEMAPRVHNSGHWSIEGAICSQFENHLRAICGLPLGDTQARCPTAMLNLIGDTQGREASLALSGVHWHDYGKKARSGRKVGHVTLTADDAEAVTQRVRRILPLIGRGEWLERLQPALARLA